MTRRDDPKGGRSRFAYDVTEEGKQALLAWLRSERTAPTQIRDESVLTLFFADALPHGEQIVYVRRMRDRARAMEAWMRADVFPAAEMLEQSGVRHPHTVARLGADIYGFAADWLNHLAQELDRKPPSRAAK